MSGFLFKFGLTHVNDTYHFSWQVCNPTANIFILRVKNGISMASGSDSVVDDQTQNDHFGVVSVFNVEIVSNDLY
jgi:hypothetical protein